MVGCGALGAAVSEQLARAGVGYLRLIDRDIVEFSNLQRQCLYTEQDATDELPKAEAAAQRLRSLNSEVRYQPEVAQLDVTTIDRLLDDVDMIVDGCDNFATRHLINEWCQREQQPWCYTACVQLCGLYADYSG